MTAYTNEKETNAYPIQYFCPEWCFYYNFQNILSIKLFVNMNLNDQT